MFVQFAEPPVGTGTEGAERSSRTCADGLQAETLPALSVTWNCTSVSASAAITAEEPDAVGCQVAPPLVEVRNA